METLTGRGTTTVRQELSANGLANVDAQGDDSWSEAESGAVLTAEQEAELKVQQDALFGENAVHPDDGVAQPEELQCEP